MKSEICANCGQEKKEHYYKEKYCKNVENYKLESKKFKPQDDICIICGFDNNFIKGEDRSYCIRCGNKMKPKNQVQDSSTWGIPKFKSQDDKSLSDKEEMIFAFHGYPSENVKEFVKKSFQDMEKRLIDGNKIKYQDVVLIIKKRAGEKLT